jgi:TonB-linked SusC/RagA family outer membrane protein
MQNFTLLASVCRHVKAFFLSSNVRFFMKVNLFALCMTMSSASFLFATNGRGQDLENTTVVLFLNNASLSEALRQIEKQTDFRFTYKQEEIKTYSNLKVKKARRSVKAALDLLLHNTSIVYEQVGNYIVLTEKPQASQQEAAEAFPVFTVSGAVTSESGDPMPGVNVIQKGTTNGTTTDANGKYSLAVSQGDAVLVFSFIGYTTQEVAVNGRSVVDVGLLQDVQSLAEVVVVGYGTQIQREVTGSIATLKADQLEDQPVGQFAQKIQGRIAGVQINQVSGTPGGGMAFRIRGAASINAGNSPLFVVDGFPIVGDINNINPNEIESFSVLKGASAAALYGSRAANGVVLITTKRAKEGKTIVQFNASYGVTQVPQQGRADLMNAKEFLQFQKELYEDRIKDEGYTGGIPELYQNPEGYTGKSTDWYDVLLRTGTVNNYNVTISSGKENFRTSTIAGYYKEDGSMLNTDYERYSLRTNNELKVNDFIRVGINVAPTHQTSQNFRTDGNGQMIYQALSTAPIFSPFDTNPDGSIKESFSGPGLFTQPNWYKTFTESTDRIKSTRLLTNAYSEVEFLKNFRFKTSLSLDLLGSNRREWSPSSVGTTFNLPPKLATAAYSTDFYYSWLTENTINFSKTYAENHQVDALIGYSAQKYREENNRLTGTDFPDDDVAWIDAAAIRNGSSNVTEWSLLSMYSRFNYNYKGKYLLSASVRRDGSSRFGSENRWGTFPSFSAGWIISDEDFAKSWSALSYLKIRGEYGYAGNFSIGNYRQFGNIASTNYVFGDQLEQGRSPVSIGNPYLTWETTRGMDIGVDVGLFNDRVSVTMDYYDKSTSEMLYQVDIPYGTGFSNIQDNIGEFHFWGYEFGVNSINLVGDFKWNTDFNISFNRNKVIQLGTNNTPIGGIGEQGPRSYWKTEVGRPMGQFFGYVFDGLYMTQEEFDTEAKHITSALGTTKMRDLNDDGVIDSKDKTYIGDPNPDFVFGLSNSFSYKNFDLNIVMSGAYGADIFAFRGWNTILEGIFNVQKDLKDRWRSPENPGAGIHARSLTGTAAFGRFTSSKWVVPASYLTIKNITLGYTCPLFSKSISKVRVFASIQQALILTNYPHSNPEASLGGLNGLELGFDANAYPVPRTYALGLNFDF